LGEESACCRHRTSARVIVKDIYEVSSSGTTLFYSITHRPDFSPASRSSASRSIDSQSSRVIGVAGPLSNASRSLVSSSRFARRLCASRMRARRYSLAEAYPSWAISASTKAFISSGTEMFIVVIGTSLPTAYSKGHGNSCEEYPGRTENQRAEWAEREYLSSGAASSNDVAFSGIRHHKARPPASTLQAGRGSG
jgi:hypothetical protein